MKPSPSPPTLRASPPAAIRPLLTPQTTGAARLGRFSARAPARPPATAGFLPGPQPLRAGARGGLILVPDSYDPAHPAPLVVFLHGAGGDAQQGRELFEPEARQLGAIFLLPESAASTWDVIVDDYGPDVAAIDQALERTFRSFAIDPRKVAVGGFSDGASYALSLALANGDLITHVLAFSPGFSAPRQIHGASRYFVSHGARDPVLPVDRCSRAIVPRLQREGYQVRYLEFDGGHAVPPHVRAAAACWLQDS